MSVMTPSRRARRRVATVEEIKAVARGQIRDQGASALSLRALARDMGMTAPALYRYFASREELLDALVADIYDELTAALVAARDAQPDDVGARLMAASREYRRWALAHPAEFALVFGSPLPGLASILGPADAACARFGAVFAGLFGRLWAEREFPVRAVADPLLREQLATYGEHVGGGMPVEALKVFLECWVRLFGFVCLESFGHLSFALLDPEPLFEEMLRSLSADLGLAGAAE